MLALWFLGTLAGDRFIRLATTTASFNMHGSNPIDQVVLTLVTIARRPM